MKKSKKNLPVFAIAVSLIFLCFFIVSLAYLLDAIKKPVTIEKKEASDMVTEVVLYTSPTVVNAIKGESFTVDLDIDTKSESVSGADIKVEYDINHLIVNSVTPRDFFPKTLKSSDDLNGHIELVQASNKDEGRQGVGTLATISFTALRTGETSIAYNNISQVAASEKLVNVLTGSTGTTVKINSAPAVKSSSADSVSEIVIYASGTKAKGQYPTMELIVENKSVAIFYNVAEGENRYSHRLKGKVEPNQIKIRFTNDYNGGKGEDRNLKINKIQINGADFETENQNTYSVGTWSQDSCGAGFNRSEWLYCNGEFSYVQ